VEVIFNEKVVLDAKRIGGNAPLAQQAVLLEGTSVTGLYAVALKPLRTTDLIATVHLTYTSLANGQKTTLTRQVRARDLTESWQRSSRRHRLASLGAVWGETLKARTPGFDVARRAEELATQDPKDARAKELAAAANASADGSR
jgi:hypothetical protein